MRYLVFFLMAFFIFTPAVDAQTTQAVGAKSSVAIYGHGNSRCSDYNQFRFEQNDAILKNYQVWLNGMLSSYNTFVSKTGDVAGGLRSDELMLWVEDFCRLNPNTYFQRAAIELLRSLETGQF